MKVIKRNGITVDYDGAKLLRSIHKAIESSEEELTKRQERKMTDYFNKLQEDAFIERDRENDTISVEQLQNIVEEYLMRNNLFFAAKNYIKYREEYKKARFLKERIDYMGRYVNNTNNAAGSSETDDNANVLLKNVANLNGEVYKVTNRQIQRQRMKDQLGVMYDSEIARRYIKDLEHHTIYAHDESSYPVPMPYTYSCKEVVEVMYNGKNLLLPLDLLYSLCEEREELVDDVKDVNVKYPWHLYVKDLDNKFVKVERITKKKRHRKLCRVKTAFGEDLVVTDNHPMIVNKDNVNETVEAINSLDQQQYRCGTTLQFKGIAMLDFVKILPTWVEYEDKFIKYQQFTMKRYIDIDGTLGYIIGFFVGDGNYENTTKSLNFTQKDKSVLEDINGYIFDIFGISGKIYKENNHEKYCLRITNKYVYELFRNYFKIQDKAQNKILPYNILEFNEDFAKGCLAGLVDSDGTVDKDKCLVNIRLSSRACIVQCTSLFRHFGYGVGNGIQNVPFGNNKEYHTNYTVWGVSATKRDTSAILDMSFKCKEIETECKSTSLKYKSEGYCTITSVEEIGENSAFLAQNEYIYDLTTETHTFNCNNILVHNCSAYSLYPLLMHGVGNIDGVTPYAPKNLDSFCGQIVNLVFLLASQVKGAVALGGLFVAFDWYCIKEWGENFYEKKDENVYTGVNATQRTVEQQIVQFFQQIIWGINQPAGNRSAQSPFTNVSYYDKNYYAAMFEDFCYPDGTKPSWEQVDYLQRLFMKTLNKERLTSVIAFPVETMCLLSNGVDDILDQDYKQLTAEMYAEGHSFFTYISDSPSALASCCFSGNQKVLWRSSTNGVKLTPFKELHETPYDNKKNLKIFHNGSWVSGKSIELPYNRDMYKVVTYNNKEFVMTDNHINVTLDGEKYTSQLTTDDYLMFNTLSLNSIPEQNKHLTYEMGFVVGAFLGDGSMGGEIKGTIYDINFSQNEHKYSLCMENINKCAEQLGISTRATLSQGKHNVYSVRISSKVMVEFIKEWTNWERGVHAENKDLNLNCLLQSYEFRKGILDGWYNTDGGNSNRCYTTSPKLAESMETLITSLGMQSIINISDRVNEKIVIRETESEKHFPLYCVRWYTLANRRNNKDVEKSWVKKNNSIFFKIKSIEKVESEDKVYCIECKNQDEPYFTLPSGLITHNCRLRNEIDENVFSFTNGLSGLKTGSCNVITLNLNRIVQDYFKDTKQEVSLENFLSGFKPYFVEILERVYKYHTAYKTMLYNLEDKNMLTASTAGYIRIKDLFSTIGMNGINEAAMFLGIDVSYNDNYKTFCRFITSTIKEQNKRHSNAMFKFNQEFVPAESLGVKNFNWDKEDGYWVPDDGRVLYNSYFYDAHDNTSIFDKIRLHGREMTETLDGGVGLHINLDEHLSAGQYLKILDFIIKHGCSYFTFNIPNTKCNDCGHITKHNVKSCPKCGSENLTKYTRIIGYLRPTSAFSKGRMIEEKQRTYTKKEDINDNL